MEVGETCSKQIKYEKLYPKRDISTTKHDDRLLVQQEYKRFLKDTKKKDIEISEGLIKYQNVAHVQSISCLPKIMKKYNLKILIAII